MKSIKKYVNKNGVVVELWFDEEWCMSYRYAIEVSYCNRQVDGYNEDMDCFAKCCFSRACALKHFNRIVNELSVGK